MSVHCRPVRSWRPVDPLGGPARRRVLRVARTEKGSTGGGSRAGHAFQIALVLFALFWLTVGFGVIDLVSGFTPPYNGTNVLSSAYGAIAAVVLPLALFAQLRARQTSVADLQVIAAVALSFALAGVLALDPLSFISVATLAAMLVVLLWLHPSRPRLLQFDRPQTDRSLASPQSPRFLGASMLLRWLPTGAAHSLQQPPPIVRKLVDGPAPLRSLSVWCCSGSSHQRVPPDGRSPCGLPRWRPSPSASHLW